MKYYSLSLLLLLLTCQAFSQDVVLTDEDTHQGIPYATVVFLKNNIFIEGRFTDQAGMVNLNIPSPYDALRISCVGYEEKTLSGDGFKKTDFTLKRKIESLPPLMLSANAKPITLGYFEASNKSQEIGLSRGLEIAVLIRNDSGKKSKIRKFMFETVKIKQSVTVRIHVYAVEGKDIPVPGKDLINDNVIVKIDPKDGHSITVDLEKFKLLLPENGAYFSIEGLDGIYDKMKSVTEKKELSILFATHQSESQIYATRNAINDVGWININEWLPRDYYETFKIRYKLKKLYVPNFGIQVLEITEP